jgi:hypothetical protein
MRFLADIYLTAMGHYVKSSSTDDSDTVASPSAASASDPLMLQSAPSPLSSDVVIPDILTDIPGCSSTVTLQHGTLHSLCDMARLAHVALFRWGVLVVVVMLVVVAVAVLLVLFMTMTMMMMMMPMM